MVCHGTSTGARTRPASVSCGQRVWMPIGLPDFTPHNVPSKVTYHTGTRVLTQLDHGMLVLRTSSA